MKLAWLEFAIAFGRSVFPQPGRPHRSTPAGASIPTARNSSGRRIGDAGDGRETLTLCRKLYLF
ncbi:hypothetical protein BJY52DRAFT_1284301 [Lactarius psammicola]|nr:hypothetical protein BJY52DRAFT_1299560 [Lactarius psammicola]KAI9454586.1 hypothetical protein BJY52DRAFT_1284301 [Lactarius psammicola]